MHNSTIITVRNLAKDVIEKGNGNNSPVSTFGIKVHKVNTPIKARNCGSKEGYEGSRKRGMPIILVGIQAISNAKGARTQVSGSGIAIIAVLRLDFIGIVFAKAATFVIRRIIKKANLG